MASLSVVLLSDEELLADEHPELNIRLVVDGIAHDLDGLKPPQRLEIRMPPSALNDLAGQIRAVHQAQAVRARARAERDLRQERTRAARAAVSDSRVETGVLQRVALALRERTAVPPGGAGVEVPPHQEHVS